MEGLAFDIMVAAGMGLIGAVVFAAMGLVSGTDETTTLAPLTLIFCLVCRRSACSPFSLRLPSQST